MDDGRAALSVFGVNDDVPAHAVLFVAVGAELGVGGLSKRDEGVGGLIVNKDQIPGIDATDFPVLTVNHRA